MAGTLTTVADYVGQSRSLLQDLVSPYRYSDDDLVAALNFAFYEIARVRPDILFHAAYTVASTMRTTLAPPQTPTFSSSAQTASVSVPDAYKLMVLYFIVGYAQLRDLEEVQDARASQFINKFASQLLAVAV